MMSEAAPRSSFLGRQRRRLAALLAAIVVALLLVTYALPAWLKSAAENFVTDKTGHRLSLVAVRFSPTALALRIEGLRLEQPDGKPLLAFRELLVDLSASSLTRRTFVFDAVRLDNPQATVALLTDGRLNWSAFIDALKSKDDRPDEAPPRLDIEQLTLVGGRIDFADHGRSPRFETRFEPIDLELSNVSTLPNDQGQYHVAARTAFGAAIDWRGRFTLAPVAVTGSVDIAEVALARLAPYLRSALNIAPPDGKARLATDYRIAYAKGKFDASLDKLAFAIQGLALRGEKDDAPSLALDRIELKDGRFDLATRHLTLASITVGGGRIGLVRGNDGRLNVEDWFAPAAAPVEGAGNTAVQTPDGPATASAVTHADTPASATHHRPEKPAGAGSAAGQQAPGDWQVEVGRVALDGLAVRLDDHAAGTPRSAQVDKLTVNFTAAARLGAGAPALTIDGLGIALERLAVTLGKLPPLTLERLAVEDGKLDLAARQLAIGRIALDAGRLQVVRRADGSIPLLAALQGAGGTRSGAPAASMRVAEPAWHYRIDELRLAGFEAGFRDETVAPAAEVRLKQVGARVRSLSDDRKAALPVSASLQLASGGKLEVDGTLHADAPSADLKLALADLALKPVQPYLSRVAHLELAEGRLSTQGRVGWNAKGTSYRGGFALRDLRINEAGTSNIFLAWKSLDTTTLNLGPQRLDIAELTLDGIATRLVIEKDKSVNVQKVLIQAPTGEAAATAETNAVPAKPLPAAPPTAPTTGKPASATDFVANIDRLRIRNGDLDVSDLSLTLPFGARIHSLNGAINGLSTRPGAPGQVELDGQVDDYGLARAVGQVNFYQPTKFMNLPGTSRTTQMSRLTPYTATFAGRRITSGKLSLDLEYKIDKRQLHGENQVIMDQLTLGERIDSPTATNLPLDLAIAILQDSDGRIDLGLPVSGSLDDPQFSYGQIVWKAILNVITKIATAPFRALGALFGGGEKFEKIAFEPGAPGLTPPEREKLQRLAAALGKRPALALTIHGVHGEVDRPALQDLQLRLALAEKMGLRGKGDAAEDPGPMSTQQPKVQEAIEALFAERLDKAELATLKDGFRQANPGQLKESTTGRMMSRLSGLFREKRALGEKEVAQMRGADFHALLYDRLRQQETVSDARLQGLARTRGEAVVAALQAAGVPTERLTLAAPEKIDGNGRDVPMKLVLGAAKKLVAPVDTGAKD